MKVRISEVFTSVEGEGILYGTKTLFVRLAGCPFGCFYCDTPESLPPDSGTEYEMDDAAGLIKSSLQKNTYKVNFTGGDPLMQHEAVALLAAGVQRAGIRTYLESSCFDAGRFRSVLPHMDIVKIEFKTSDSGFADPGSHERLSGQALECLGASLEAQKTTYVKVVASSRTDPAELGGLARAVAAAPGSVEGFVIQPTHGVAEPSLDLLMEMYDAVYQHCAQVRVVPQLHKLIGAP